MWKFSNIFGFSIFTSSVATYCRWGGNLCDNTQRIFLRITYLRILKIGHFAWDSEERKKGAWFIWTAFIYVHEQLTGALTACTATWRDCCIFYPCSPCKGVARGNFKTRQTFPSLPFPSPSPHFSSPPLPYLPIPSLPLPLEVGSLESS